MTLLYATAFWLGLVLISLSWRLALPMVTAPEPGLAFLASLGGASLLVVTNTLSCRRRSRLECAAAALVAAGLLFLVTGVSSGILLRVAPALHDIPLPAHAAPLIEKTSWRLSLVNDVLGFWDGRGLHEVRLTFEGFGLYEIWYILVGAVFMHLVFAAGGGAAGLARTLGLIAVYVVLRLVLIAAAAIEFGDPSLLWRPGITLTSYLPAGFMLAGARGSTAEGTILNKRRLCIGAGVCVLLLLGTVLPRAYQPRAHLFGAAREASAREEPAATILIDESHSNWEWATEPFDTASFGIRAEYNYYCLAEYLDEFHEVTVTAGGIMPGALKNCDVLVIKTPTQAYDADEIDAIVDFVRDGGGLFLIGDHDNLFGMTTYLNAIAGRFGVRFRCDDTFDLATGGFSRHAGMGFWTHPAVRNIEGFRFLTSCTIEGGLEVEPVMLGLGLGSEDADYGHPNFFGNMAYDLTDRFGVFTQAAAVRFGRGRVLLFTDSTCFSNFCMFSPGTPDLALSLVGFLAGGRGDTRTTQNVIVDTTHSRASFFDYMGSGMRPSWQRFEEFYMSFMRFGMRPRAGNLEDTGMPGVSWVVIVNPQPPFAADEVERVSRFIAAGGRLLLIDSALNSGSGANELLQVFGMGIMVRPAAGDVSVPDSAPLLLSPVLEVAGGETLAADPAGRVVAARAAFGAGAVVVTVDSYACSQVGLGRPLQPAHAYERSTLRYRALFDLMGQLR